MAEDDRPGEGDRDDYRYFGPFGPPPDRRETPAETSDPDRTAPLGIGHWTYGDEDETALIPPVEQAAPLEQTRVLPVTPGPSYGGSPGRSEASYGPRPAPRQQGDGSLFPAPPGVVPLRPQSPEAVAVVPDAGRTRKPLRAPAILLLATLLALLIGGAAGYGGSRLAALGDPAPQQPVVPTSASSPSTGAGGPTPPSTAPVPSTSPAIGQANTVEVAKAVLPSSVMIQVGSGAQASTGSGFILDAEGRIMTNNHVVAAASDAGQIRVVYTDGTRTTAELVGRSPSYDLAVIKVDPSAGSKAIQIGNSDASQVGESVIAIGSPLGLPGTVTEGIVSAKNRPVVVSGSQDADAPSAYINAIQTDAPINPGNSGGPLIDSQARVIGVNSAILTLGGNAGQSGSIGLGFAIPINQAMEIANLLIRDGKATYPVIGANVSNEESDEGVRLTNVDAGGPASAAGLQSGDLLTTIDGNPAGDAQQLIVTIRTHRPGEHIKLGYERGGVKNDAEVILGSKEG